jgi:hypothetical protein
MRGVGTIKLIDNRMNHDGLFRNGKGAVRWNCDPVICFLVSYSNNSDFERMWTWKRKRKSKGV